MSGVIVQYSASGEVVKSWVEPGDELEATAAQSVAANTITYNG